MNSALDNVRIVLVGTQEPMNLGAVARAMQNFGVRDLCLVAPEPRVQRDLTLPPEVSNAYRMAVHSGDILRYASQANTLAEAVGDTQWVVATTVRERGLYPGPVLTPAAMAQQLLPLAGAGKVALVFGREASGLRADEVDLAQSIVRIPTSPKQPSLNLAQAVLLICYELFALENSPPPPETDLAQHEALERLYEDLREYMLQIGFTDQKRIPYAVTRFRRLLNKAQLSPGEVQFLRGFLHQSRWHAKSHDKQPE
jgi:tRNA/rRNA methyltransferase